MNYILIVIILAFLNITLAFGQKIAGQVVDSNGNPISYVNTMLLNKQDSSFIIGTVTNKEGLFSIRISNMDL